MVRVLLVCFVFALIGAPSLAATAWIGDTVMPPLAQVQSTPDAFPALLTAWHERYRPVLGPPVPKPVMLGLQIVMVLALTTAAARAVPRRRSRRQSTRY